MGNLFVSGLDNYIGYIKDSRMTFEDGDYKEYEPASFKFNTNEIFAYSKEFDFDLDWPYYESLRAQITHLLYKYKKGWITSRRQLCIASDECISFIQFIFSEGKLITYVTQRSSNIDNSLINDISFMCDCIFTEYENFFDDREYELIYNITMPHTFGNNKTKIEQEKSE